MKLEEMVGKRMTEAQFDEAAGEKDACYRKVKARYDVWPSAYASGALVKCRKAGAANWGNKSKKEGVYEKNKGKTLYGKDLVNYFVKRFKYSTRDATAVANKLKDVGFKVPKVLPFNESVNEGKLSEDYKNSEWEVFVADENGKEKIVKKAKSKRAGVILYNKLINTDKYHEVGMRVIKEEKVNEAKMVKLILPIKDRKKAVHILQKQLKLKVTKDFEYGGKKGSNFEIELDKKFENKVIELFMKSKIKVRG